MMNQGQPPPAAGMARSDLLAGLTPEEGELWHRVQELWELAARQDDDRIRIALHPDYLGWDMSTSVLHDREQAVASASGASARIVQYKLEPLGVRLFQGSTGVVHYRYTATVQAEGGQPSQVSGQWTEVYVKQGPRWSMVAVSGRPNALIATSATA
jgi:hypothetical protein